MRILLVAPNQTQLHTFPEVRIITSTNYVNLMVENVTKQAIYDAVRTSQYDIIHFATHAIVPDDNGPEMLQLSTNATNGDSVLTQDEIAQIARAAGARLVFFNSCYTSGMAAYLVRHGTPYAIYTTRKLPDKAAWMMPATFYSRLATTTVSSADIMSHPSVLLRLERTVGVAPFASAGGVLTGPNYPAIFVHADTGEGLYGLAIDPEQIEIAQSVIKQVGQLISTVDQLRRQMAILFSIQFFSILAYTVIYLRG